MCAQGGRGTEQRDTGADRISDHINKQKVLISDLVAEGEERRIQPGRGHLQPGSNNESEHML